MITSRYNPRVKDIRRLRKCKGDRAVLEGPHLVAEAVAAGVDLETVLVTPEFALGAEARSLFPVLPFSPLEIKANLLEDISDSDSPRGIVAVAHLPRNGVTALPSVPDGLYLYLDSLQNPGNLGALARVGEAAGCAGLALGPGSVHPNHPRALRASAGSLLRLPTATSVSPQDLHSHLSALAPTWIGLAAHGGRDLYAEELDGTLVFVLGNEGAGLSAPVQECTDIDLTIPLHPPVESLNVTVAAAIVTFEWRRRRYPSPRGTKAT